MADRVRKVKYCYVTVPAKAGSGVKVLGALKNAGVNMLGFTGFPSGAAKAQLDFVTDNLGAVRRAATKAGLKVSAAKEAFLVQGSDKLGAVYAHHQKLAKAGVRVTAADGVTTGDGRYGMLLWVKPKDYVRAARALGAK